MSEIKISEDGGNRKSFVERRKLM